MNFKSKYLHCGDTLLESLSPDINELISVLESQVWTPDFSITIAGKVLHYQTAYNKSLSLSFSELGWRSQPRLSDSPRLIGDFSKGLIFGEVQFGNSATLYRDFYKFQYGHHNGLLGLAARAVLHITHSQDHNLYP